MLTGDLWAAYPAAISKSFKKTYKVFHERKKRYSGKTKMSLYGLFNHSARVFSVFKYRILVSSLLYSTIFFFMGSSFYFFIFRGGTSKYFSKKNAQRSGVSPPAPHAAQGETLFFPKERRRFEVVETFWRTRCEWRYIPQFRLSAAKSPTPVRVRACVCAQHFSAPEVHPSYTKKIAKITKIRKI